MAKTKVVPIVTAGAVLLAAFLLNPSPERHRDTIRETVGARTPLARLLSLGAVTAFASNYHSLGLASYTTAGQRVLSVGALGMVYVRD